MNYRMKASRSYFDSEIADSYACAYSSGSGWAEPHTLFLLLQSLNILYQAISVVTSGMGHRPPMIPAMEQKRNCRCMQSIFPIKQTQID